MARESFRFRSIPHWARWHAALHRVVPVLLAFALGSAGQPQSALAAPGSQASRATTTYVFNIVWPKAPVCAGMKYDVGLSVDESTAITRNGRKVISLAEGWGIAVTASSSNASVGTIGPPSQVTDMLADLRTHQSLRYVFAGQHAGSTTVTFVARRPGGWSISSPRAMQVVNCKYKVSLDSAMFDSHPNLSEYLTVKGAGEIKGPPGERLAGTAPLVWKAGAFSECFIHLIQLKPARASLVGELLDDGTELSLSIDIDPVGFSRTTTFTCHQGGGTSGSGTLQPPSLQVNVPSTGGFVSVTYMVPIGESRFSGTAFVTVSPVEDK